jgi:hypothetical protein
MTTAARHPLVEDYLRRLWEEAARLPVDQARELVADIEDHVGAAVLPDASEADVRNVLERLGSPRELVDVASGTTPPAPKPKSFASPGGAIICLVAAELLSIALPLSLPLWIVGLVMMARATVWSERDRMLGLIALGSGFPAPSRSVAARRSTRTGAWSATRAAASTGSRSRPGRSSSATSRSRASRSGSCSGQLAAARAAAMSGPASRSALPRWEIASLSATDSSAVVRPGRSSASKTAS